MESLTESQFHTVWTEAVGMEGYNKKLFQNLLAKMVTNGTVKKLSQAAVMCRAGDFVKEVGGDWIRVLRVEGRNIYLDYGDGLNCLDVDDVISWKHGT